MTFSRIFDALPQLPLHGRKGLNGKAKVVGRVNGSNLWHMRSFYLSYPILDAVRRELSWTHYRLLLRVDKPDARAFYEAEAVNAHWSTRELERQIHSLLFERLALSRDREGVLALAEKGHEIQQPSDLIKDPYVLEFTGLPQSERYLESETELAAEIQRERQAIEIEGCLRQERDG